MAVETKPKRDVVGNPGSHHHGPWVPGERDSRSRERKEGDQGGKEGQVERVGQEGWGESPRKMESSVRTGTRLESCPHSLASNWHIVSTQQTLLID